MQKRSSFSASSPTSVVAWVVNVSHSDRCQVVSHCGFDLYFPDDEWCGAFFHVSVGHLDVFFGEVSIHVFCPFLHWIVCSLGVEFDKFFIDFGYKPFIWYVICKYLLPFSWLPFSFSDCFLRCAEAFYFDGVPIVQETDILRVSCSTDWGSRALRNRYFKIKQEPIVLWPAKYIIIYITVFPMSLNR